MANAPAPLPATAIVPPLADPQVPAPPIAANPPNVDDVLEAESYVSRVRAFAAGADMDRNIVADSMRYAFQTLARFCGVGVAPQAPGLQQRVDDLERMVAGLMVSHDTRITVLENYRKGAGFIDPLGEVRLPDGSLPTAHNYPLLNTAAVVDGLTDAQVNWYYQRYYPNRQLDDAGPHHVRKEWIKQAIGCWVVY